jgi:hypothetical protein
MLDLKDQMIEEAQERRERNENVLDDIESSGENFEWFVLSSRVKFHSLNMHSPSEYCDEVKCAKQCFASGHFNWCLEHSAPSSEDVHGTYRVTEVMITKVNGQITESRNVIEKPKCALAGEHDSEDPCCNIVQSGQSTPICTLYKPSKLNTSDFMDFDDLREFEMDQWMAEQMGKSSP